MPTPRPIPIVLLLGAALPAQTHLQWKQGLPAPGPAGAYAPYNSTKAGTWWDPDGVGPSSQVLVFGGTFTIPSLGVRNLAWFDPAAGEFAAFAAQPNGEVRAIAVMPNGDLVVGGSFTAMGGVATGPAAIWNGSAWAPLGGGISGPYSFVRALQVLPNGELVVGGAFTQAGTLTTNGLARWNGSQWQLLSGISVPVHCMALHTNGDLVVGGEFPGSVSVWNGAWWTNFTAGLPVVPTSLAVTAGNLVVAATQMYGLRYWDGVAWTLLVPAPLTSNNALLALPNGDLLVSGITSIGSLTVNGIARFDGSQWSAYAPVNGVAWMLPGSGGDLWIGGTPTVTPATTARGIARWDGATLHAATAGFDDVVQGLRTLPNGEVFAHGWFRCGAGVAANHAARWDGKTWVPMPSPLNSWNAGGQTCSAIDDTGGLWLVDGAPATTTSTITNTVYRWNGSAWTPGATSIYNAVALVIDASGNPIVGLASYSYTNNQPVLRWTGSAWVPLGNGLDGPVRALLRMANGDLIAGGEFLFGGTAYGATLTPVSRIARWSGASWQPLGPGLDGPVRALLQLPGGDLVAAGDFVNDGTLLRPLNYVARFDGTDWQPFGEGIAGGPATTVRALTVLPDGGLVVGGRFDQAGGRVAHNVARWNGTNWREVDGGTDGMVLALAATPGGDLFAGGEFGKVDSMHSAHVARLRTNRPASTATYGSGCAGGAGAVTLQALNQPWVGATYRTRCSGVAANAIGIEVLGLSAVQQPLQSVHPFAGGNCSLLAAPDLLRVWLSTAGTIDAALPLPRDPILVGATLYQQMLVAEPNAALTITRVVSSNGIEVRIGSL
ncbi:MAG: hypothetical protein WAT39_04395 [Planctomycetota bacterium]